MSGSAPTRADDDIRRRSRLVLVGAGGAGREVLGFVRQAPAYLAEHSIDEVVFVDDIEVPVSAPAPVISGVEAYRPLADDLVLCTVNEPGARKRITDLLAERGARFTTFVHPTAVIAERVTIGEGAIITPHCSISVDIEIGRHAYINMAAVIGHDVVIGDHVTVGTQTRLLGGVRVADGAWFGASATVLPGAVIGAAARVGAGSVVLRRVRPATTVFGNPAVPIGPIPPISPTS